jgi:hypothetical protein
VQVLNHELGEVDLRDILGEAMQGIAAGESGLLSGDNTDAKGTKLQRSSNTKQQNSVLSLEELDSATKWLLERFGFEGSDDDDGSDDDVAEVKLFALLGSHTNSDTWVVNLDHAQVFTKAAFLLHDKQINNY